MILGRSAYACYVRDCIAFRPTLLLSVLLLLAVACVASELYGARGATEGDCRVLNEWCGMSSVRDYFAVNTTTTGWCCPPAPAPSVHGVGCKNVSGSGVFLRFLLRKLTSRGRMNRRRKNRSEKKKEDLHAKETTSQAKRQKGRGGSVIVAEEDGEKEEEAAATAEGEYLQLLNHFSRSNFGRISRIKLACTIRNDSCALNALPITPSMTYGST